ncbi:hypothetical protein evm_008180 [Chilo suppressalis]|nr:hypothetical protein evm_008180 [Chilo suppressalis]
METSLKEGEDKELDDSGCVQDVCPAPKQLDDESQEAELLDLSDDVLLLILKHCSPRDLKALGYTCPRLGRLIKDRTLWQRVDARGEPTGRARLRWFLAHALGSNTTELKLTGYAREAKGCLGHVDRKRKEIEEELEMINKKDSEDPEAGTSSTSGPSQAGPATANSETPVQIIREDPLTRLQRLYAQQLPRYSGILSWPEDGPGEVDPEDVVLLDGSCPGPQFTFTQCTLRQLRTQCSLTSLTLQYCNINCNTTGINHFPPTLKRLSLRGSKCYNLPLDKSFLFNIQDYLPQLEYLDLSECEWLEPASFLPLSKVSKLTHLIMRDCHRMAEFVAYASLATRYGFRKLQVLDVRGSPLGDSEVAALGWLPVLQELYAMPARCIPPPPPDHSHCRDERLPAHNDLEPWEMQEPEYFQIKPQVVEPMDTRSSTSIDDIEEHIEQLRNYENNICLHGVEYNMCMEGIRCAIKAEQSVNADKQSTEPSKSSEDTTKVPAPPTANSTNQTKSSQASTSNETEPEKCVCSSSRNITQYTQYTFPPDTSGTDMIEISLKSDPSDRSDNETQNYVTFKRVRHNPSHSGVSSNARQIIFDPNENKSEDQPGPSLKRCQNDDNVVPSKKSKSKDSEHSSPAITNSDQKEPFSNDEDSSDEEIPLKKICKGVVNDGASTSQSTEKPPTKTPENSEATSKKKKYDYVRFRQNMEPVIVRRDAEEVEAEEREREERDREMQRQARERQNEENQNVEARPRAHVLYVNVGQQLHTVYRLSIHNEPPIFYSFARNSHLRFRPNVGNIFYTPPTARLDATSLITDSALRRFGRADIDDINVVNIGPCRPPGDPGARPNKSNLRVLSVTGFRSITDRSLEHLATAAPHLRRIDFSESGVTQHGVENFKSLRPDCEVIFSEYVEKEDKP